MISEFSKQQEELYVNVCNDWKNRSRHYTDTNYEDNCARLLNKLFVSQSLPVPMIIYLDSPLACLLARMLLKKMEDEGTPGKSVNYSTIREIWATIILVNQCFGIAYDFDSQHRTIIDKIGEVLIKKEKKCQKLVYCLSGGNLLGDIFHSRNVENVKKNISCFIWDEYFYHSPIFNGDFMMSSLNLYSDFRGETYPWTYHSLMFYDFMTRLGLVNDTLFSETRNLLINDVLDIVCLNNVCLISKLPLSVTRNEDGQLHSYEGNPAIAFADGYRLYFENGKRVSKWDIYNKQM